MKALIVVDMQNDFIDGSLGSDEAKNIVAIVVKLVDSGIYDEVIFTRDTHGKDYLETAEGKKLPVEHCIKGTRGWEIADALNTSGALIIDKATFGYTGWGRLLDRFEDIHIVGLCTDICVISNALIIKSFYPEKNISIIRNATAGTSLENKEAALTTAVNCQVDVI